MSPELHGLLILLGGIFIAIGIPVIWVLWQMMKIDDEDKTDF